MTKKKTVDPVTELLTPPKAKKAAAKKAAPKTKSPAKATPAKAKKAPVKPPVAKKAPLEKKVVEVPVDTEAEDRAAMDALIAAVQSIEVEKPSLLRRLLSFLGR